jgi:hypothetical protein
MARRRARRSGLDFNITVVDLTVGDVCPALGIPMNFESEKQDNRPTIDRINNRLGYIKGNVIVVSMRANRIKSDAASDELARIAAFYRGIGG